MRWTRPLRDAVTADQASGVAGPTSPVTVVPVTERLMSLGEGPTWDEGAGVARWVDINAGRLFEARVDGRTLGAPRIALTVDGTLGAAVHAEGGGLLLATARHLEHRAADGTVVGRAEILPQGSPSRLNDGACDPSGRYVVGSVALDAQPGRETLWRLEHDGTVTVIDDDLLLSNGVAWSPKGDAMYHVDTFRSTVFRRAYDAETGEVGEREALIATPGEYPDGMTVSSDGDVWVAFWLAGEVRRYSADGALVATLSTGAPLTTSCAFVGADLDLLLITTAASAPGAESTARSGALLACAPGARGIATRAWRPAPMDLPT